MAENNLHTRQPRVLVKMFSAFKQNQRKGTNLGRPRQDVDGDALYKFFTNTLQIRTGSVQHQRERKLREVISTLKRLTDASVAADYDLIVIVFLMCKGNESGETVNCYDEPLPLKTIFDTVKNMTTPKLFLIQSDDMRLIPCLPTKANTVPSQPDNWNPGMLPNESIMIMSTIPQQLAQYQNGHDYNYGILDPPTDTDKCSFLVRVFMEVLGNRDFEDKDFDTQAIEIDTRMQEIVSRFNGTPLFQTRPLPFLFRERNLSGQIYFR